MALLRLARPLVGAAFLAAALASVHPAQAAPKELTIGIEGDVPSLDPSKDTAPLALNYRLNVFDALTEIDRTGAVQPRLASEWSKSADLREWTFKLRQGVKFHDGGPLTAADVVFTTERILADTRSPVRQFLKLVEKVEAVDDHTVRFRLTQPYAIFDRQIKYLYVMSKKYVETAGDQAYLSKPIGSGPYRLVQWTKDDRMVLEAFDGYWGGKPLVERATFRPIPADASRANALLTGEIDIAPNLPPSLMAMLQNAPGLTVGIAPGFRVAFVSLDPTKPPFDNPKLREAVDVGIDRVALATQLLRGTGEPTGIMIPPTNEGYDAIFKPVAYDPARAKALVKEAGYDGTLVTIDYPNNNSPMANEVAQAIAGYMTAAGLKVRLNPMEFTAFFPLWLQNKMNNAYSFAFGSSQYHAETVLATLFEKGAHNYRVIAEIDRLVKAQREEPDRVKQQDMINTVFRINREDRMYLPLYNMMQVYGVKKTIDYKPYPDSVVRLYTFQ